jgi:hypothetical protein
MKKQLNIGFDMKSNVIEHMTIDLVAPELRKGLANMYMSKAFRFGRTMVRTKKVEVNINKTVYSPYNTVNS